MAHRARIIAKHEVAIAARTIVTMSPSAKVIHVDHQAGQHGRICLWVEDEDFPHSLPAERKVTHEYYVVGTGSYFPNHWEHVGTVVLQEAGLVWHLYEDPDPEKTRTEGDPWLGTT